MRRDRFRADFNFIKGGSKGIFRDTVYPFVLSPPADLKWNGDGEKGEGIGTVKKIPGIVQKMQRRQCVDRINACDILCSLEMKILTVILIISITIKNIGAAVKLFHFSYIDIKKIYIILLIFIITTMIVKIMNFYHVIQEINFIGFS